MNDPAQHGQILPESRFGQWLTNLARDSENIVDVGTWRGGGSTQCLVNGIIRKTQKIWTVEIDGKLLKEACDGLACAQLIPLNGSIIPIEHFKCFMPFGASDRGTYEFEWRSVSNAEYVGGSLPDQIDLMVLDGGEFSTQFEWEFWHEKVKVVAMDDTNPLVTNKNVRNRFWCLESGWTVLEDKLADRNGWFIACRT